MGKSCLILGVWIPNKERIKRYVDVLVEYYSHNCDIFIGINPSDYVDDFINELSSTKLSYKYRITDKNIIIKQHASANQTALELYSESDMNYSVAHISHTKGISYSDYHYNRAFNDYYLKFGQDREVIESFLDNNEEYGAWSRWGMIQPQWFCKKGFDLDNIPHPPIDVNYTMAQNVEESTDQIHPYFNIEKLLNKNIFTHTPIRTQYLIAIFSVKNFLLKNFIHNVNKNFFNKSVNQLGYDLYFFETQFSQICDRQGYKRHIEDIWNIGNYGDKQTELKMFEIWEKENIKLMKN